MLRGDIDAILAYETLEHWASQSVRNVRFSGGEPTLHPRLIDFVSFCKKSGVKRIAISTNGSADLDLYKKLISAGVNDVSISLDACCASTGDIMSGKIGYYDKIINTIQELSKLTYVTIGIVINELNIKETKDIINTAISLGVSDIRIIPSAQHGNCLQDIQVDQDIISKYSILKYRINNSREGRVIRGLTRKDCPKCYLVWDDMAVCQGYHFPCIIYLREGGKPIGNLVGDITRDLKGGVRRERYNWFKTHNSLRDDICKKNCLDVCAQYNSRVDEYIRSGENHWNGVFYR